LLGYLPDGIADQLEQHTRECEACAALLPGLQAEDTLVRAMRDCAQDDGPPLPDGPTITWPNLENPCAGAGDALVLDDRVPDILRELVTTRGPTIGRLPVLCRTLLKERCAQFPREMEALLAAVDHNIVARLPLTVSPEEWNDATAPLVEDLIDASGEDFDTARWVIDAWYFALEGADSEQTLASTPGTGSGRGRRKRAIGSPDVWSGWLVASVVAGVGGSIRFEPLDRGLPEQLTAQLLLGGMIGAVLGVSLFKLIYPDTGEQRRETVGRVKPFVRFLFLFLGPAVGVLLFTLWIGINPREELLKHPWYWMQGQGVFTLVGAFLAAVSGRLFVGD
jgi:hypothetical protein